MAIAKKTAAVKTTKAAPTSMVKWDAELAKYAAEAAAVTSAATGNFISFRGGVISVDKNPVPGNKLECVVTGHVFENAFYGGDFDADNPTPPVCFAFGIKEDDMKPHEKSSDPQHPQCTGCPQNEWGSADKGNGKACKNIRRLGLIPADAVENGTIEEATILYAKTPVTSSKAWDGYVRQVTDTLRRPPFAVVTSITAAPDPKKQFVVSFALSEKIDDSEAFGQLVAKHKQTMKEIDFPYTPMSEEERNKPRGKKGAAPSKYAKPAAKTATAPKYSRR